MTTDPRPLFAEFNRGVQRARDAYDPHSSSPDPTCRAEGCHRARDGHHTRCGTCRKAGRQ